MTDKLDNLFANIHNNERAIDFMFLLLINGNNQRFDKPEDINEEYMNVYGCTHGWYRSSGLHHIIYLRSLYFIYIDRYVRFNVVLYNMLKKRKENIILFFHLFLLYF